MSLKTQSTMDRQRIYFVLLLLAAVEWIGLCENPSFQIYIKNIHCNASERYVHSNLTCFAKSYSRNVSTVTLIAHSKQPVTSVFVEIKLSYKYGMLFREVLSTGRLNWCELMKNWRENLLLSELLTFLDLSVPGNLHECPYTMISVINCTLEGKSLISMWPAGEYKMEFILTVGYKILMLNAKVGSILTHVKSHE